MTVNIDQRIAQLDRKAGFRRWGRPVPFAPKNFFSKGRSGPLRVQCRLLFSVKGFVADDIKHEALYKANGGRLKHREQVGTLTANFFEFHDQMYQLVDGRFLFLLDGTRVKTYSAEQIANEDFDLGTSESACKLYRLMGFFRRRASAAA